MAEVRRNERVATEFRERAVRTKPGVKLFGLRPELVWALSVADGVYRELNVDLVITSVMDGKHSVTSLHYAGAAADLRIRDMGQTKAETARDMIEERLTDEFDVVLEKDHIHLEVQPRRVS